MANEKLPLGIRFTARDIETANITSEVQKAINTAIANTDTKTLRQKFSKSPINITVSLSKKSRNIITKNVQSAINKVGLTFTKKNVKTKGLIDKVRKGVSYAISTIKTKQLADRLYKASLKVRNGINVSINSAKFSDLSKRLQQQLDKPYTVTVGKITTPKKAVIKMGGKITAASLKESIKSFNGKYSVSIRAKIIGLKRAISQTQKAVGAVTPGAPAQGAREADEAAKAQQRLAKSQRDAAKATESHTKASSAGTSAQRKNAQSAKANADAHQNLRNKLSPAAKGVNNLSGASLSLSSSQTKAAKAGRLMFQPFNRSRAMTDSLSKSFQEAGVNAELLGARVAQIAKRFSGFFIYTAALFKFLEAIRATTEAISDLDRTTASLSKVLKELSSEDIEAVNNQLIEMAINTKRSYGEAATAMRNFARAGLSTKDAMAATKGVLDLLNISTVDAATASKLIITTFNAFNGEMEDLTKTLATFSDLADASAIDVLDLAQGFIRSAAAANAFGVSQEQLAAAIATVGGVTQLQATRVGTAFKTIFSYLGQNRREVLALAAEYRNFNTSAGELDKEFSGLIDTLQFVSEGWSTFTKEQKTAIGQLVGGKRRFNELSALMGNFTKFQQLYNQSLEESNAIQRKSQIEAETLAARHRELGASIVRLAKLFTDLGATDFYKNIVSGLSTVAKVTAETINGLDSLSGKVEEFNKQTALSGRIGPDANLMERIYENATSALTAFIQEGVRGTSVLTNSFIYLFARVVLPQIRNAARAFKDFITGNESGINRILAAQAGYTKEVANSVSALSNEQQKLSNILSTEQQILQTRQRTAGVSTAAVAGGAGTTGVAMGGASAANVAAAQSISNFAKQTDGMTDAMRNAAAVARVHRGALSSDTKIVQSSMNQTKLLNAQRNNLINQIKQSNSAFKTLYLAVRNGIRIQRLQNKSGIAASRSLGVLPTVGQKVTGFFGKFRKRGDNANEGMKNFTLRMVLTVAAMQAVGAAGRALASTVKGLEEEGSFLKARLAGLGSTVLESTAPLIAFGKEGALAGITMGAVNHLLKEIGKALRANAEGAKQAAKNSRDYASATELAVRAQNDYLIQLGLVERGMGEFVKNLKTGELEFKVDFEAVKGRAVTAVRQIGLGELEKSMKNIVTSAATLTAQWNDAVDSMKEANDEINNFQESALDLANTKVDLQMERTRDLLGYASDDLGDLLKQANEIQQLDIKFLAPAAGPLADTMRIAKGTEQVMRELHDSFEAVQAGEITRDEFQEFFNSLQLISKEAESHEKILDNMIAQQSALRKEVSTSSSSLEEAKSAYDFTKELDRTINNIKKAKDELKPGEFGKLFDETVKDFEKIQELRGAPVEDAEDIVKSIVEERDNYSKNKKAVRELAEERKKQLDAAKRSVKDASTAVEEQNEAISNQRDFIKELRKEQKESALENLRQIYSINKAIKEKISLQGIATNIQISENSVLNRNVELRRSISQELAQNGTEMSKSLDIAIQTREELAKSAIAVRKLEQARTQQLEAAGRRLGGIVGEEAITKIIDLQIKGRLREQIQEMITSWGESVRHETERIRQLEQKRFEVARDQLERLAELETRRSEISQEITSAWVDSARDLGATDIAIGNIIDSGEIGSQISNLNSRIEGMLSNQAKIQLAHSLERIQIEKDTQETILDEKIKRANQEEKVLLQTEKASLKTRTEQKRNIAVADALRESTTEAFSSISDSADEMKDSLQKMIDLRGDISSLTKEIDVLKERLRFQPSEELQETADRQDSLEARKEEIEAIIQETQNRIDLNNQILENNATLVDAKIASQGYVQSVMAEVGAIQRVTINRQKATENINLSEEKIQQLRVDSARDTVERLKEEYDRLQSYGEELYGMDVGNIYKLAAAQRALQDATGDLSDKLQQVPLFLRDTAAEIVKTQFGAEGEQAIAVAGLERVGLDSSKLESIQERTVDAAKEAAELQKELIQIQIANKNNTNAAVQLQRQQIDRINEDIKRSEEAQEKIDALNEKAEKIGSIDQTLEEQLTDAKERKKFLQQQLSQEAKHYSANANRINQLLPGAQVAQTNLPKTVEKLELIRRVLERGNTAEALSKAMEPYQNAIQKLFEETTGGRAVADEDTFGQIIDSGSTKALNVAIDKHQSNIVQMNESITELRNIFNTEHTNAQTMINRINAVNERMSEIINRTIEEAGRDVDTVGESEAFKAFSKAISEGILIDQKSLDAQAKATEAATQSINKELEASAKSLTDDLLALGKKIADGLSPIVTSVSSVASELSGVASAIRNIRVIVKNVGTGAGGTGGATAGAEIGNQALGLSSAEMRGVINAAQREKRSMPNSAGLTVANTSELVMTPNQAKKIFGQVEMPSQAKSRHQDIFRGGKTREVIKEKSSDSMESISALTNKINDLLERADKKELFKNEQAIAINVDGKREINLKGMKSFDKEIRDVFKKQIKNISTKAEVNAVKGTLRNLIRRLKEAGIDGI